MKVFIPENLDLKNLLCKHGLSKFTKSMHIDKLHFFVHLIYEQKVLYKNKKNVCLKAEYLRFFLRDYQIYRSILEKVGIIECDYIYIKSKKSFSYSFSEKYSSVKAKQIELEGKKIQEKKILWKNKRLPNTSIHKHLYKMLSLTKIQKEAVDWVNSLKENNEKKNSYIISINKFYNKDFFLYKDNYDRVHTNITILKSSLRRYLIFNNKKLSSIDINNSQPLLLLGILKEKDLIRKCTTYTLDTEEKKCTSYVYKDIDIYNIYHTMYTFTNDIDFYEYLVSNGFFYDFLSKNLDLPRNTVKKFVFRDVLFGKHTDERFCKLFPSISKLIIQLKKNNYKRLAHIMQRFESKIVISGVCGKIMNDKPNLYINTIHDSILTEQTHVDYVKNIFQQVLDEYYLKGSFSVDNY